MSRIKLTDIERLILANQYEILAELKNDESYASAPSSFETAMSGCTLNHLIGCHPICPPIKPNTYSRYWASIAT